jgi:hypothetical protein
MSLGCGRTSASDASVFRRRRRDAGAVAQRQEAQDLGSWQCGFESHRPHQVGQYTNRVFGRWAACGCWVSRASWLVRSWGLRYAEDRDYPARAGDLDLGDEHLDQGLPRAMAPGRDDAGDVIGDLPHSGGWRRGGYCGDLLCEVVSAGA